jgi:hypothetical protein
VIAAAGYISAVEPTVRSTPTDAMPDEAAMSVSVYSTLAVEINAVSSQVPNLKANA